MKSFVYNLEKDIEKKLKKIESADLNILKKSLEASLVLGDAFQKMKEFYLHVHVSGRGRGDRVFQSYQTSSVLSANLLP